MNFNMYVHCNDIEIKTKTQTLENELSGYNFDVLTIYFGEDYIDFMNISKEQLSQIAKNINKFLKAKGEVK